MTWVLQNKIFQWLVKELSGNLLTKKKNNKAGFISAFTMVELVFVIVIIGILSAIAIPKLAASRDDAILVKGKSQIAAIRSGIAMQKNKNLIEGTNYNNFIPRTLDANGSTSDLFHGGEYGNILEYSLPNGTEDGKWEKVDTANPEPTNIRYKFHLQGNWVEFTYYSGTGIFDCNRSVTDTFKKENCKELTQ